MRVYKKNDKMSLTVPVQYRNISTVSLSYNLIR